jgi:hypothetical protein
MDDELERVWKEASFRADIRVEDLPNTSQEQYHYTNPSHVVILMLGVPRYKFQYPYLWKSCFVISWFPGNNPSIAFSYSFPINGSYVTIFERHVDEDAYLSWWRSSPVKISAHACFNFCCVKVIDEYRKIPRGINPYENGMSYIRRDLMYLYSVACRVAKYRRMI